MKKLGDDVRLRILSVFIAIILWIYVVNIQNPEIKREFDSIPVSIENVDLLSGHGLVFSGDKDNNISVKLKGNKDSVKKIQRNDIQAFADLKDIKGKIGPGKVSIPVKINLLTSEGVEIVDKNKYSIEVEMDKYSQIQKVVEVDFEGITSEDIKYEAKSIRPNVITISGPQKLVSNIGSVKVIIDVANSEKEMSVIKRVKIFTNKNTDITDNEHLIKDSQNVQVDIDYQKYKEVPIDPNIVGKPSNGYFAAGFKTNPEKILISGHSDKINPINTLKTRKIDITGKNSTFTSSPEIIIPKGINTDYAETIKVEIIIEKEDSRTIEVSTKNISFVNTSKEYDYKILHPRLRLYLAGKMGSLDTVTESNLGLFVDAAGLTLGEHQIPVQISSSGNIKLLAKTQNVRVVVTRKQ